MFVQIGKFRIRFHAPDSSIGVDVMQAGFEIEENYGSRDQPDWYTPQGNQSELLSAFLADACEQMALGLFKLIRHRER